MKTARHFFLLVAVLFSVNMLIAGSSAAGPVSDLIKLPEPSTDGRISIERALRERRSIRDFTAEPLALSHLSQLLWAAQGMTSPDGRRTAPSAGALYPLEVYVTAARVTGLDAGIYAYKPESHSLIKIADGDRRADLSAAAHGQQCVRDAPAVLVISAVYGRTTVKYGERGNRFVHMEAGHAAQNISLQAVALKLGSVVVGGFDDNAVKKAAHLAAPEQPLYLIPVGKPQDR